MEHSAICLTNFITIHPAQSLTGPLCPLLIIRLSPHSFSHHHFSFTEINVETRQQTELEFNFEDYKSSLNSGWLSWLMKGVRYNSTLIR